MPVQTAIAAARPGTLITFTRGRYQGCFGFEKANSGTYDDPIVLRAEPNLREPVINRGRVVLQRGLVLQVAARIRADVVLERVEVRVHGARAVGDSEQFARAAARYQR